MVDVSIVAGKDKTSSRVTVTGKVQHAITDEERVTFRLGDEQLKKAVESYFGKGPNDAYLHSPTPWGDLYKKNSWPQVQTVLVPTNAEILEITSQPLILKTQTFENQSEEAATFNVSVTDTVSETVASNWTTGGSLSIGQKFEYGVEFLGVGGKADTRLSYSQSWGIGGEKSKSVTVGSTAGLEVELEPGESVVAELSASRGVMKVQFQYNAYIIGDTAVNFNPRRRGHHFWAFDIGAVMSSAGIPNSNESTEHIEIGYYSNGKIVLKDAKSGLVKDSWHL